MEQEAKELFEQLTSKNKEIFIDYLKELLTEQEQSSCSVRLAG